MRTYRTAHALAAGGHEVHVVTNAKEVQPPFRMYMRPSDWTRCEARYGTGSVTVHWTGPADRSQSYVPMASPFVSKLSAIAASVHSEHPFDVMYSHYLEPYGVAAHLASQITRVPHVVRMAGSDAGRLWHHPQLEPLYDHVLRSASVVIAVGTVAQRARERGVSPRRITSGGQFSLPEDLFTPDGPVLDPAELRAEAARDPDFRGSVWGDFNGGGRYFGIYGKLGESKGSLSLLAAMRRLKDAGVDVGLVALAHGSSEIERSFRARARRLGVADRVLQLPFLPPWRVPEFLRGCLAVCCLEQNFPIDFHSPMTIYEALLCGRCLVASTELIAKLPRYGRLPHGYGCVAIRDVNDIDDLGSQLAAIAKDPAPASAVGERGRLFARELQQRVVFPQRLESILASAATGEAELPSGDEPTSASVREIQECSFVLTRLAEIEIEKNGRARGSRKKPDRAIDLTRAREVLACLTRGMNEGRKNFGRLAQGVQVEVAIAQAENETPSTQDSDPLFRLRIRRWAMGNEDLRRLVPMRDPQVRMLEFDFDASRFIDVKTLEDCPSSAEKHRSFIIAFACPGDRKRPPLVVDEITARILQLSEGTRTTADILRQLSKERGTSTVEDDFHWVEQLFVEGLLQLRDQLAHAVNDGLLSGSSRADAAVTDALGHAR